ncbi:hypothetical protein LZC95_02100 [Pendulispora brunnea]|uniref:Uncharacterized protein n=1 Tax=Pendulispora brunnea TaxID=2905690 RepID=A0ABZ2KE87_9BACT
MFTRRYGTTAGITAAAGLSIALSACTQPSSAVGSSESALATPGRVDLQLFSTNTSVEAGKPATQDFVVTNTGAPTRGESRLVYVTPTFVNFDRSEELPEGCEYAYQNLDPLVPEIVDCTIPADLREGDSVTFTFHMTTSNSTLVGMAYGAAIVAPDERVDTEVNFTTNFTAPFVAFLESTSQEKAAASEYSANVYLSWDVPSIAPGEIKPQKLVVGNQGPDKTRDPVRLVYVSPFFINVIEDEIPRGCKLLLADEDPLMPQIVECVLAEPLWSGDEQTIEIPVTAVKGGPSGFIAASSVAAEAKPGETGSHDPSLVDNVQPVGVNELP